MMLALASSLAVLVSAPPMPSLRGPALVVLLKDGCPCARECRIPLGALADACRGKVRFVGLVDAGGPRAVAFAREAELGFPVLPDPKAALIHRLRGNEALDLRLVGAGGRTLGAWDGFDRAAVAAALAAVRRATGRTVGMDLSLLTTLPKPGCAFSGRG